MGDCIWEQSKLSDPGREKEKELTQAPTNHERRWSPGACLSEFWLFKIGIGSCPKQLAGDFESQETFNSLWRS
jgi:hypothetical protein